MIKMACKYLLVYWLLFCTIQCSKEDEIQELNFIGDSHIARWDISESFPNYVTYNFGQSGSKIDYIESYNGRFSGKEVVVISGVNDLGHIRKYGLDDYVKRYVNAIKALGAKRVFIYSIFPNNTIENTWNKDYSELIKVLNPAIEQKLKEECPNSVYLNVHEDLVKDGVLNPEYYSDGLHLNYIGYELLTLKLLNNL